MNNMFSLYHTLLIPFHPISNITTVVQMSGNGWDGTMDYYYL